MKLDLLPYIYQVFEYTVSMYVCLQIYPFTNNRGYAKHDDKQDFE